MGEGKTPWCNWLTFQSLEVRAKLWETIATELEQGNRA
jgi:hypothetical protein